MDSTAFANDTRTDINQAIRSPVDRRQIKKMSNPRARAAMKELGVTTLRDRRSGQERRVLDVVSKG